MGFFFRKRINLGGGFRLNISKRGLGMSGGVRGARIGVGPRGVRLSGGVGPLRFQKEASLLGGSTGPARRSRRASAAGYAAPVPEPDIPASACRVDGKALFVGEKRYWIKQVYQTDIDPIGRGASLSLAWFVASVLATMLWIGVHAALPQAPGATVVVLWTIAFVALLVVQHRRPPRDARFVVSFSSSTASFGIRGDAASVRALYDAVAAARQNIAEHS